MVKLRIGDSTTEVAHSNVKINRIINSLLAARPKGFQFSPKFRQGRWDGYISLFKNRKFPTGLLSLVEASLQNAEVAYEVEDNRSDGSCDKEKLDQFFDLLDSQGYEYRGYQIKAAQAVLEHKTGVLKMATNSGKTLVAASIIQATGNKALVVVPTRALLLQTSKDFEEMLGVEVGRFGAGYSTKGDIIVTTMSSLHKAIQSNLTGNKTVIIDECHHAKAGQLFDQIFHVPGRFRIGMSGTPLSYDQLNDMKLVGATGPVIYEITNAELIAKDYSVPPNIQFVKVEVPEVEADGEYQDVYKQAVVDNDYRNSIIASIADMEEKYGPVLIVVDWIRHVNNIVKFKPDAIVATGKSTKNKIQSVLQEFDGSNSTLLCTPIFGEGVNMPTVRTLILAAAGYSHIRLLQRIGRGLRTSDGKLEVVVYDFLDLTHDYMFRQSERRYKIYKDEGFQVSMYDNS